MDRTRLNKGTEPKRQGQGHRQVEGSFFSSTRPKRQYFSIHPEWVSENFSVQQMNIGQRMTSNGSRSPERRCYSAPPPRTRNPITWENPDMNELRLRDARLRAASRGRSTTRPKSEVMDAIGCGSDRDQKVPKFNIRSTFFTTTNSPRRQYFTIHPEWQSESNQIRKQVVYQQQAAVYPMRRCKSAPPPRTRNPITWDYADRPDRR